MRRAFSVYGTIISIDFGFPKDDFGEERKKFCFVQYASHSECEEAVARSTNVSIDGCRLIVQHEILKDNRNGSSIKEVGFLGANIAGMRGRWRKEDVCVL